MKLEEAILLNALLTEHSNLPDRMPCQRPLLNGAFDIMPDRLLLSKAAVAVLFLSSPFLIGATSLASIFDVRILTVHNRERAALGIAPLRWNAGLAQSAQRWADHLAATGAFEHAPELPSDPQGENLWAGTKGYYPLEARVEAWVREKRHYKPGLFPDNSVTGRIGDVGHYTQLMWRDTHEVGCAEATGVREDVLVCRYNSAGNYFGEEPF